MIIRMLRADSWLEKVNNQSVAPPARSDDDDDLTHPYVSASSTCTKQRYAHADFWMAHRDDTHARMQALYIAFAS